MLHRAYMIFRNFRLVRGYAKLCSGKLRVTKTLPENSNASRHYNTSCCTVKLYREVRTFSSQTSSNKGGDKDGDIEDGLSELDEEGIEIGIRENHSTYSVVMSSLKQAVLSTSTSSLCKVLDKWVEDGNRVARTEVLSTVHFLRKRRMFPKALQLLEWAKSANHLESIESDYVTRLDLIAKVRGIYKAEEYLTQIPESSRGEAVYCTLLSNCVTVTDVKKTEEVFDTMKNLGFPITCFSCNQLLLLYKRTDKRMIADVLKLMQENSIKPSLNTYQILIDVKGQSKDIIAMEEIVAEMKADGCEPNTQIRASLAQYYSASGLTDKTEAVLKEIEGSDITTDHAAFPLLLSIYSSLGREDKVERIWKACEANPSIEESMAAVNAWGQLNRIEKAEAAFQQMMKNVKKPSSKHFTGLLKMYANQKMLIKGRELVKRMEETGCSAGPMTWDIIVKLYAGAGEVEKANAILEKAAKQKRGKPLFSSFLAIMDEYANRGDVHNAEEIFGMMKRAGYSPRHGTYQLLLRAYVNGSVPVYGFGNRMKADNVTPNVMMRSQLAKVDAFRKSSSV